MDRCLSDPRVRPESARFYTLFGSPFVHSIVGGALMSFLPASNKSGILAGIYLVNAVVAPLAVFYNVSHLPFKSMAGHLLNIFAVDCGQFRRCNQARFCGSCHQWLVLDWQHHRAANFPGSRRARLSPSQNLSHGHAGWVRINHVSLVPLLCVAEQEAGERC